ncbi:MAG: hypothetical protein J7641_12840 [Cyanobacteria bacterium SID2]|nr:hypothetical protein [Cyanobacteria bacterium SID2]MBP0004043.1 hypothetical protein [Cyanobacteria bacterium SBC]
MAASILNFGVNFPIWDQWDTPGLMFVKIQDGSIDVSNGQWNWGYWTAQHNESRKLFPRLILVSLASLTNWNVKVEMFFILGFIVLIAIELYILSRLTLKNTVLSRIDGLAIVANLLIFSLIQYDNFLFGLQVCVLLSLTGIVTGLLIAQTRFSLWLKTTIGVLLCLVSTYSFSNGLLSWFVVFPAMFFPDELRWRSIVRRIPGMLVWGMATISTLWVYFRYYVKPPGHPGLEEAILHPIKAIHYFLVFLGSPLGFQRIEIATIVGAIVLAIWLSLWVSLLWKSRRDFSYLVRAKSWIMLGGYSIISGLVAALGRVGFGIEQAIAPRYTTFSLYAIVSAIYLGAVLVEGETTLDTPQPRRRWLSSAAYTLLGIGLVLHFKTTAFAIEGMRMRQTDTRHAQACTLAIEILRDDDCLSRYVYPDTDRLYEHATAINALGYLTPPLLTSDDLQDIAVASELSSERDTWGAFESLKSTSNDLYQVRGWSELPERHTSADIVLLTYTTASGSEKPFTIIDERESRPDVLRSGLPKNSQLGWLGEFSRSSLPSTRLVVKAWAFDATIARAYLLPGTFELPPTPSTSPE